MEQPDPSVWATALKYGWTAFLFLFGLQHRANKELHRRISNVKEGLVDHRLGSTEKYVTKSDHKDMLSEIRRGFERIENKLDGKVDK